MERQRTRSDRLLVVATPSDNQALLPESYAVKGSVMLETRLPKEERDFAMLFHSDGKGNVTYRGLSLFFNGAANAYGGNIVATQDTLRGLLDTPSCRRDSSSGCHCPARHNRKRLRRSSPEWT